MEYEIVNLEEKKIVGLTARTNNSAPDMGMVIGGLWNDLYQKGIYQKINNKANEKAVGLYSDYESDMAGDYDVTIGCEVKITDNIPGNTVVKVIPAGKYAKFVVRGHMQKAVQQFWQELWKMKLDRKYTADFEEYQDDCIDNAEVHIYIALK